MPLSAGRRDRLAVTTYPALRVAWMCGPGPGLVTIQLFPARTAGRVAGRAAAG